MSITVNAARMPGHIQAYTLDDGATVNDLIAQGNFGDLAGYEIKLNGRTVQATEPLTNDAIVLFTRQVKGNEVQRKIKIVNIDGQQYAVYAD